MRNQLDTLKLAWDRLNRLPAGKRAFSRIIGQVAPYSGSIRPQVIELRKGYAKVQMKDKRRVRNHLQCIHAVALVNLAEITSGLAFIYSLPPETRSILTGLSIEYLKKSRGTLTAECRCEVPNNNDPKNLEVEVITRDSAGDVVTKAKALWLIGPQQ